MDNFISSQISKQNVVLVTVNRGLPGRDGSGQTADLTPYTLLTTTGAISAGLQTQVSALNSALPNYSLLTTTTSVSAGLQGQVAALSATTLTLTPLSTTAAISAGLSTRINGKVDSASLPGSLAPYTLTSTTAAVSSALQASIALKADAASLGGLTPLTTTAAISASLQAQVSAVNLSGYALTSTVSSVSAGLQSQITNKADTSSLSVYATTTVVASVSAGLNTQLGTKLTSSSLAPYELIAASAAVSAGLQTQITGLNSSVSAINATLPTLALSSTVAAVSAFLQGEIAAISAGGSLGNYTLLSTTAAVSAGLQTQIANISASGSFSNYTLLTTSAAISAGLQATKVAKSGGFAGTWNQVVVNNDGIVTFGQLISGASSGVTGNTDIQGYQRIQITDHFIEDGNNSRFSDHSVNGGGVNFNQQNNDSPNYFGVYKIQTGFSGTTGYGALGLNPVSISFGQGASYVEWIFKLDSTLSAGSDTYNVRIGALNTFNSGSEPGDGVFFRYSDSVNGGRWQAVCVQNGTSTAVDTGVSAAANTWIRARIVINAGATSAAFQMNGATVATVNSNIPNGQFRVCAPAAGIEKTAGTTNVAIYVDMCDFRYDLVPLATGNSADLTPYTLLTTTANLTGNLQSQITSNTSSLATLNGSIGNYALTSTVAAVSAGIQVQLNSHTASITAINAALPTYAATSTVAAVSAGLQTQITNSITNALSGSCGQLACDTSHNFYTVTHPSISATSVPIVTLVAPTSAASLYVASILAPTNGQFQVTLSGTPAVSGYIINWLQWAFR